MKTLLIIGGTGFFGKSFEDYYQRFSFENWGIGKLIMTSRSKKQNKSNVEFVQFSSETSNLIPKADYIIYAASSSDSKIYINNGIEELNSQIKSIYNFHNILKNNADSTSKILYTSSGAIYGQSNLNHFRTDERTTLCKPSDNDFPKNIYANIKNEWEQFLLSNLKERVVIARCFAFVGNHLPLNTHFAIGNFIDDTIKKKQIKIKSNYKIKRSYMHADDLVEWLLKILVSDYDKTKYGNIFNVGSSEEVEIHDLSNIFYELSGKPKISYNLESGNSNNYVPNIDLTKKVFGLDININLKNAINKSLSYHENYS